MEKKSQIVISIIVFLIMVITAIVASTSKNNNGNKENNTGTYSKQTNETNYYNLKCYKNIVRDNYELSTKITLNYKECEVTDLEFDFNYYKRSDSAVDGYTFSEVEEIANLNLEGITTTRKDDRVIVKVDFEKNSKLKDNEILKDYSYNCITENNVLSNEMAYSCVSTTETVYE